MDPLGLPPQEDSDRAMPGPSDAWKALSELHCLASDRLWDGVFGARSRNCSAALAELGHRRDSAGPAVPKA